MKNRIVLIILLLSCVAGCNSLPPRPGNDSARAADCKVADEREIRGLFKLWDEALESKQAVRVANLYAENAILLPTVSDKARIGRNNIEDYFVGFLKKEPRAEIDPAINRIETGCNMAVDSGYYKFTFEHTADVILARYSFTYKYIPGSRRWFIVSHHSSVVP